jgi:colanic acid biosynthesis glycosyl transferase WcaI
VPSTGQPQRSLLIFGINYAPEPTGIAVVTTWLTEALTKRGWGVTMITGMPHYPSWHRQPAPRRTHNGAVAVRRHLHYVPARQSALRRATYELTWTATATRSLLPRRRPDLVLGIVPSLGGGVLARLASTRYGAPYALLFQDVMGRAAEQTGVPGSRRLAGVVATIETAVAREAAGIAVVADGFSGYFRDAGIPATRIHRVRNPARLGSPTKSRDAVRAQLGWKTDEFVVLHSGSMGYKQGLETVLDAAALARDDRALRFVLQGEGHQKAALQALATKCELPNVSFLPLAPVEELPNILSAADALLLSQRQSVRNMSLPSKLTSYFLAGVPIVAAVARDDEAAGEIEQARAGVIVDPNNPMRLLAELRTLRADRALGQRLGLAGRAFGVEELSESLAICSVDTFLRDCLGRGSKGGRMSQVDEIKSFRKKISPVVSLFRSGGSARSAVRDERDSEPAIPPDCES